MALRASDIPQPAPETGFDPDDWKAFSSLLHRAVDDMVDYISTVADRPAWQPIPDQTKALFETPLPETGIGLDRTYEHALQNVTPYPTGNIHPRFWSWVGGTGTPHGIVADLMISTMNAAGLGFDEAATTYVELQLLNWLKSMFDWPETASGLLVSGGSMANLVGLAVARNAMADFDVRSVGLGHQRASKLRFYASTETHSSVRKALELLGLGANALTLIDIKADHSVDIRLLRQRIECDRAKGLLPIAVVANAGTVNTGAIDPLDAIADLCAEQNLWMHVDGAFGAMAYISELASHQVRGLQRADSLAFDLHKWMYQQYDIGCVLIRDQAQHRETFNITPAYLKKLGTGLASGPTDFSALGVQLSRSARALRAWMTIQSEGIGKFRRLVDQNILQARYLSQRVVAEPQLELAAPTILNIVNFRYRADGDDASSDQLNQYILEQLHERGIATPSSTVLNDRFCIRVAICNHRSRRADFDALIDGVLALGQEFESPSALPNGSS